MRDDGRARLGERRLLGERRGRKPRIADTPSDARVEIRLTEAERIDLGLVASGLGIRMAELLRLVILRKMYRPWQSAQDHFEEWKRSQPIPAIRAPEVRSYQRIYRAMYRAMQHGVCIIDAVDLEALFRRDGGICALCHLPVFMTDASIDHVMPISKGGEHSYANSQLSHRTCNSRKGNRVVYA